MKDHTKLLEDYAQAWNNKDIDKIMQCMTDDCIFETGSGTEKFGTKYSGPSVVRERFMEVWEDIPNVQFEDGIHFCSGDHGCSEWTMVGTHKTGAAIEMNGCDIFTIENGKIKAKRSYVKNRQ